MCGHLAVEAEKAGAGPVVLIDTDPQGSVCDWWNSRAAPAPQFTKLGSMALGDVLADLQDAGTKLVMIDTPPAVTPVVADVIAQADLVLVPTRPSPHDLRALGATVEIADRYRKPLVFVINAATARARITAESAVALSQHGTVAPVMVHQRVEFAASMVDGRSVSETTPNLPSAKEVRELWAYVHDRLARISGESRAVLNLFSGAELKKVLGDVSLDEQFASEDDELLHEKFEQPAEVSVTETDKTIFEIENPPRVAPITREMSIEELPELSPPVSEPITPESVVAEIKAIEPESSRVELIELVSEEPEPTLQESMAIAMSAVPEPLVPLHSTPAPQEPATVSATPEIVAISTWEPKSPPPIKKAIDTPIEVASRKVPVEARFTGEKRKGVGTLFGGGGHGGHPFGRRSTDQLVPFGKAGVRSEPT